MGEILEPFEIKAFSPILFNLALDKVIEYWGRELRIKDHLKPLRLGRARNELEVGCVLAFALLTDNHSYQAGELLKECAGKVGVEQGLCKDLRVTDLLLKD